MIQYNFKRWGDLIFLVIIILIIFSQKSFSMLILNRLIYKSFQRKNLQDISIVEMYWIATIQIHFQSNYYYYYFLKHYRCVHLWKIFNNEVSIFSFGQSMKKITMVKVGYFNLYWTKDDVGWCWNVSLSLNLSHILCQKVSVCKLYNYVKENRLHQRSTRFNIHYARATCDEPIKNGLWPKS